VAGWEHVGKVLKAIQARTRAMVMLHYAKTMRFSVSHLFSRLSSKEKKLNPVFSGSRLYENQKFKDLSEQRELHGY
jgi:hypothetical protein